MRFDPQNLASLKASFPFSMYLPAAPSVALLGYFHTLPNNLISAILRLVDINTCLEFCRVNRRARKMVFSLIESRTTTTRAPTCFLAVLRGTT
jgi:hypothetical protein